VVIGEYCDGCETFWPLKVLERRRRYVPAPQASAPDPNGAAMDEDVPAIVRLLRGNPE